MDRENLVAPGWSHVLSTTNDLEELERFRERMGAPPRALHIKNPARPHLDLKLAARDRALADPAVLVFESTKELVLYWRRCQGSPDT